MTRAIAVAIAAAAYCVAGCGWSDATTRDADQDDAWSLDSGTDLDGMDGEHDASDPTADGDDELPPAECGNREIEPGEECDDGNGYAWDGCDACSIAPFEVNTTPLEYAFRTSVAMAADGRFVVAWDSLFGGTGMYEVMVREFEAGEIDGDGDRLVNGFMDSWQYLPDVAMDSSGGYVVVWQSYGQDGDGEGIFGRAVEWGYRWSGSEVRMTETIEGDQEEPSIAMSSAGQFVVTWRSFLDMVNETFVRPYGSTGSPDGPDIALPTGTGASVGMFEDGSFIAAWSVENFETGSDVFAMRFDAEGNPDGYDFVVNTIVEGSQDGPRVAVAVDGRHVVTWRSGGGLRAQFFAPDGSEEGGERMLLEGAEGEYPSAYVVGMSPSGEFVVAWLVDDAAPEYHLDMFARVFDSGGSPLTDVFPVCDLPECGPSAPSAAMDASGRFVIVWRVAGDYDDPGEHDAILAQRYDASGNPRGSLPW